MIEDKRNGRNCGEFKRYLTIDIRLIDVYLVIFFKKESWDGKMDRVLNLRQKPPRIVDASQITHTIH
jgi:hypothetical protein